MNASNRNKKSNNRAAGRKIAGRVAKPVLPAMLAVGSAVSLIAAPVSALELGELQIDSTLGQPLRASIAYALSANEELFDFCIKLDNGAANGLQALTRAKIAINGNRIFLRGSTPIREPMLAMRLSVKCPYTAHLARDYMLMIDPPGRTALQRVPPVPVAVQEIVPVASGSESTSNKPAPGKRTVARVADPSPIRIGSEYRVQAGDSLSAIASRIADRPVGLWQAVDALFLANPDAFVNGDRDRVKAGSRLTIPAMQDDGPTTNVTESLAASNLAETPVADSYEGYVPIAAVDSVSESVDPAATGDQGGSAATDENGTMVYEDDTSVLASGSTEVFDGASALISVSQFENAQPGDVFAGNTIPANASIEASDSPGISIPDTTFSNDIVDSAVAIETPDVAVAASNLVSDSSAGGQWSWLIWLGGSGLALILGLLIFGRKIRNRFATGTLAAAVAEDDDEITQKSLVISDTDTGFDSAISKSPMTEQDTSADSDIDLEHLADLDLDLGAGTGLENAADMDIAEDFGFSPTGENATPIDLDIGQRIDADSESPMTDIIAPRFADSGTESILDSEVPPGGDNASQYDLSMVVDATKQALGDVETTAKDLMAVQLPSDTKNDNDSQYTMNKEIDFTILEQDYEEELTATQALNEEIAKAALALAEHMDSDDAIDVTAEMPAAEDLTVALPSTEDATSLMPATEDLTSVMPATEELTAEMPVADDLTAEMPLAATTEVTEQLKAERLRDAENDDFVSDLDDTGISAELTAEMPKSDITIEIEVESGTVDTKKLAR